MNTRKIFSMMVMAGMLVVAFQMAPLRAAAPVEDKASIAARVVHEVAIDIHPCLKAQDSHIMSRRTRRLTLQRAMSDPRSFGSFLIA